MTSQVAIVLAGLILALLGAVMNVLAGLALSIWASEWVLFVEGSQIMWFQMAGLGMVASGIIGAVMASLALFLGWFQKMTEPVIGAVVIIFGILFFFFPSGPLGALGGLLVLIGAVWAYFSA